MSWFRCTYFRSFRSDGPRRTTAILASVKRVLICIFVAIQTCDRKAFFRSAVLAHAVKIANRKIRTTRAGFDVMNAIEFEIGIDILVRGDLVTGMANVAV